jgi:predicted nucleotidyltransferase
VSKVVTDHPHALTPAIRERFCAALARVESAHGVVVLHACESGSRAWGFASADSDYDVRFIYAHPRGWYLSVFERCDVIELPLDADEDINGWDLRKALRLLAKSNPVLLEWLQSPLVYRSNPEFRSGLLQLGRRFYSPSACHYHYYHMAQKNVREHLRGSDVRLKKYFYVLRPLLACQWIERGWGAPPVEFMTLVESLLPDAELRSAIVELRRRKMSEPELGVAPQVPVIRDFIEAQIARLAGIAPHPPARPDAHPALDAFLQDWVNPETPGAAR